MHQKVTMLLVSVLVGGCMMCSQDTPEHVLSRHYVLEKKDSSLLEGPYKMEQVLSPVSILVAGKGERQNTRVVLRGCIAANQKDMDFKAVKTLGTMWPEDVYLRKDSVVPLGSNAVMSVVYDPANQKYIGKDKDGRMLYDTLTYTMPQLLMFVRGYCLLDHSDTNYPLYQVFVEAEELARKQKKGYWATHREPPVPSVTNGVSSVTTNHLPTIDQ